MKENKKNVITIIVAVVLLLVFVIGLTYALFTFTGKGRRINQISTTSVTMSYSEAQNGITLTNAMPISDVAGIVLNDSNQTFEFTVSVVTGSGVSVAWEVAAEKLTGSNLDNDKVRIYLEKKAESDLNYTAVSSPSNFVPEANDSVIGTPSGEMILDQDSSTTTVVYNYKLRMWVSDTYIVDENERTFSVRVNVYGKDNYQTVSGIDLGNDVTLNVEDTHTLTATVTPVNSINASKIKWCSSSDTVISGATTRGRCNNGEYEIIACYGSTNCEVTGLLEGTTSIMTRITNDIEDTVTLTIVDDLILFNNGDLGQSGGWSKTSGYNGTVSVTNVITLTGAGGSSGDGDGIAVSNYSVDLTKYSTIHMYVTSHTSSGSWIGLAANTVNNKFGGFHNDKPFNQWNVELPGEFTLDISEAVGYYYIYLDTGLTSTTTITKVWVD